MTSLISGISYVVSGAVNFLTAGCSRKKVARSSLTAGSCSTPSADLRGMAIGEIEKARLQLSDGAEKWLDDLIKLKYFEVPKDFNSASKAEGRKISIELIERGLSCLRGIDTRAMCRQLNAGEFSKAIRVMFPEDLLSDTEVQQLFYIATGAGAKRTLDFHEFLFTVFWLGTNERPPVNLYCHNSPFSYRPTISVCYAFLQANPSSRAIFKGVCTHDQYANHKGMYLKMTDPFLRFSDIRGEDKGIPSTFLNITAINVPDHYQSKKNIFELNGKSIIHEGCREFGRYRNRWPHNGEQTAEEIFYHQVQNANAAVEQNQLPTVPPEAPPAPFPKL